MFLKGQEVHSENNYVRGLERSQWPLETLQRQSPNKLPRSY